MVREISAIALSETSSGLLRRFGEHRNGYMARVAGQRDDSDIVRDAAERISLVGDVRPLRQQPLILDFPV